LFCFGVFFNFQVYRQKHGKSGAKKTRMGGGVKRISSYTLSEKDVGAPPLSIGENRRSQAVAVTELLNLHPPLPYSGADISKIAFLVHFMMLFLMIS
jgi:hypothetical protein